MNMFEKAKKIEVKPKATKKSSKAEIGIAGLEALAAIRALEDSLASIKLQYTTEVQLQMVEHFVKTGMAIQHRPENFTGIEGQASASCQLKKRSLRSILKPDEVEMLTENGVSTEKVVTTRAAYIINPDYSHDMELLGKVSAAIESIVPEDFLLSQSEVSSITVPDVALNEVFKVKDANLAAQLLGIVSILSVNSKMETQDINYVLDTVKKAGVQLTSSKE